MVCPNTSNSTRFLLTCLVQDWLLFCLQTAPLSYWNQPVVVPKVRFHLVPKGCPKASHSTINVCWVWISKSITGLINISLPIWHVKICLILIFWLLYWLWKTGILYEYLYKLYTNLSSKMAYYRITVPREVTQSIFASLYGALFVY